MKKGGGNFYFEGEGGLIKKMLNVKFKILPTGNFFSSDALFSKKKVFFLMKNFLF